MTISAQSRRTQVQPLAVAASFLGMFVVGSLAVQLLASGSTARTGDVPPVVAHEASLWSVLGER